jgi:hypothetical protein
MIGSSIRRLPVTVAVVCALMITAPSLLLAASPAPGDPAAPASGLSADCVELTAAVEELLDPVHPRAGRLIAWVEASAASIRSAPVPRSARPATREIASELEQLADELRSLVGEGSETDRAIDGEALGALLGRLDAADRFAATTSLGAIIDCRADEPAPAPSGLLDVTLTEDGLTVIPPVGPGRARLVFTNASTTEAGLVLIWSDSPMSASELAIQLDGAEEAEFGPSFAIIAVAGPVGSGVGATTDLLLPDGYITVLPMDADGVVGSVPVIEWVAVGSAPAQPTGTPVSQPSPTPEASIALTR